VPTAPDSDTQATTTEARARELLARVSELDTELAWELGLYVDSLAESSKELGVRVAALEQDNRQLQERIDSGQTEYAQLRASMDELLNLHELSEAINTSFDVEDILAQLMNLSARVVDYDGAGVYSLRDDGSGLEAMALRGERGLMEERVRVQWEDGIVDWVLREARPVVIDDMESSEGHTFAIIPLMVRGKHIGLFILHSAKAKDDFTLGEIELLGVLGNQTAAAIENSRLYTDLEAAHTRLTEQQRQLLISAKQAAIGELAGGVAHEVNNALQIILSRVQLMVARQIREGSEDSKLREGLQLIEDNVKRISRIIRALLGFASHNTIESEGQLFSLASAIQQAYALTRHHFEQQLVETEVDVDDELPQVFGSVGELEQVFINLMLNAANAMPAGGRLAVRAAVAATNVEAHFQDTGAGIQPEHIDRIFEPFFTTRADSGGTGLGLAVSYRIVENHGGTLTVESEPGTGATFIVRLPIPDAAAEAADATEGVTE
jgi:signal transduction histidine kinase